MIKSKDWQGQICVLCHESRPIMTDETFQSRNNTYRVTGGSAPHKPSSQGKIFTDSDGVFYPSVLGLRWAPESEVESDINELWSEVIKVFCAKTD